jgi:CheY-like chemotaxis protein
MPIPPIFLVIEVEQPEGLSGRKLIIESAKKNVLTAYSGKDGLTLFDRVPPDVAVVHSEMRDMPCTDIINHIKTRRPDIPVVVVSPLESAYFPQADHVISSHDPHQLLELLENISPNQFKAA